MLETDHTSYADPFAQPSVFTRIEARIKVALPKARVIYCSEIAIRTYRRYIGGAIYGHTGICVYIYIYVYNLCIYIYVYICIYIYIYVSYSQHSQENLGTYELESKLLVSSLIS